MGLDRFFNKNHIYNAFEKNKTFKEIYDWLSQAPIILRMTDSCKQGKPALEGIIEDFIEEFGEQQEIPFSKTFNRQMIGSVVKEIIWDYGYLQTENDRFSRLTNGAPFSSGMKYEFFKEYQTKELRVTIEQITLKKPISMGVSVWNIKNIQNDIDKKK
jgi:hypothetical protein